MFLQPQAWNKFTLTFVLPQLMNDFNLIDSAISQLNETALANILQYGDSNKGTPENNLLWK